MRIESFWARGFRSLWNVRLDPLGPFNVFYGPNGSGKSNVLAAMDAWLRLIPIALQTGGMVPLNWTGQSSPPELTLALMRGHLAYRSEGAPVRAHDFALHSSARKMTLGGKFVGGTLGQVTIELYVDATRPDRPTLNRYIEVDGLTLEEGEQIMAGPPLSRPRFRAVEDPHTGIRDLREWLPPPLDKHDISLDLAGLGIAQVY